MPRLPVGADALELAAKRLAGWRGSGQSWLAECDEVSARTPAGIENPQAEHALSIRWRGRVIQAGERGFLARHGVAAEPRKGRFRIRQMHAWGRHPAFVAIPRQKPLADAAGALAMAKLPGPLAPLLLLYACEDLRQWRKVERFALACYPHREAVGDAMQRILWGTHGRFSPTPKDQRAKELGIRASDFRTRTRRAEAMLRAWLDRAAWAFLIALLTDGDGTEGNPENSKENTGRLFARPVTHPPQEIAHG